MTNTEKSDNFYTQQCTLRDDTGNNRFNFTERTMPHITIPALRDGTLGDITVSPDTTIECDVDGTIVIGHGLQHLIYLRDARVPTWICDNHNHAYYFWHKAVQRGYIPRGLAVIHIDQHTDLEIPRSFREKQGARSDNADEPVSDGDLAEIGWYTNNVLTIADFIIPAMHEGLISTVHCITDETEMSARCFGWEDEKLIRKSLPLPTEQYILDLDLDYFAQGFDTDLTMHLVKKYLRNASIITIATSPLFIELEEARKILKNLQNTLLSL